MKFLFNLLGMIVAGTLGYLSEPSLRYSLTGKLPVADDGLNPVIVRYDENGKATRMRVDLGSLSPQDLPERVTLKKTVQVMDPNSGTTMKVEAGGTVKPLRIENRLLVFSPGVGAFEGRTEVTSTDLLEQLSARPTEVRPPDLAVVQPRESAATDPPISSSPVVPATEDPAKSLALANDEPEVPVLPDPAPEPEPEPSADPEPEPEMTADTGPVDVINVMQESVKAGQITEFNFDQVTDWKEAPDETVDGKPYKIGVATYQKETIFGVSTIQAKALIQGGKVARWVGAKSGLELK